MALTVAESTVATALAAADGPVVPAFQAPRNYPIAAGSNPAQAGDFDGDGDLDLVTFGGMSATVAENDGAGGFVVTRRLRLPADLLTVSVGDVDSDGDLDLGFSSRAKAFRDPEKYYVVLNNGRGDFGSPIPSRQQDLAEGAGLQDLNSDGKLDLATASGVTNSLDIQLGKGDGTFAPASASYPGLNGMHGLGFADVNGDGVTDVLVASNTSKALNVYLGVGDGTFIPGGAFPVSGEANRVVPRDVDADGDVDAIVFSQNGSVSVLGNAGTGVMTEIGVYPSRATYNGDVAVADFNNDGAPDIAVASAGTRPALSLFLGRGDGSFVAAPDVAVGQAAFGLVAADLNGDDLTDLASTGASAFSVALQGLTVRVVAFGSCVARGAQVGLRVRARDAVTWSVSSSNPALLPKDRVVLKSAGKVARLTIRPVLGDSGRARLIVRAKSEAGTGRIPITVRVGTSGADKLAGTGAADVLMGGAGDDVLSGLAGDDTLCPGTGRDVIRGGPGRDFLRGGTGVGDFGDLLVGGRGNDRLRGSDGRDRLLGQAGDDKMSGGRRGDHFDGGAGTDEITDFNRGSDTKTRVP